MISKETLLSWVMALFIFLLIFSLFIFIQYVVTSRRRKVIERLQSIKFVQIEKAEDELARPFLDRTIGAFSRWLVRRISNAAPKQIIAQIDARLENAGRPRNLKASDLLAIQGILGVTLFFAAFTLLKGHDIPMFRVITLATSIASFGIYLPWFALARLATQRQKDIRKNLPDIMDLLVISVEAGSSFDMALMKVVEKYKGTVAREFQKVLQEINLGKSRKDSLKDMADRVNVMELSSLVHAVIQSEQLGVGLGNVLRMQSDLIREKRQQWIEEQALKAPIKMLFPLVFFIFPSMFIVILGPAMLNIMKVLGR